MSLERKLCVVDFPLVVAKGMVNPYLELNRVMTQKRISADRLLASGDSIKGGGGPSSSGFGDDPAGSGSGSTAGSTGCKEIEHNSVSFGKWFFFCQHCRHGGHATCIDQWFGGTGAVSSSQAQESVGSPSLCVEVGAVKRRVCGVNGCDCRCVARL